MVNSFSNDSDYLNLVRDFETLAKVQLGDKLAVSEGKLILTPKGFIQSPLRTVKNLFSGGYNRNAVASYIEDLAQKTEDLVKKYNLASPDFTKVDPAEYKKLTQLIKFAATKVSQIEFRYRPQDFLERGFAANRLSTVYNRIASARDALKGQVKAHPQIFHALPKAPIDFNAPVDLAKIKNKPRRGVTPDDILKLAESAKKQDVPTWKKVATNAGLVLATIPVMVPLQLLSLFKWVIWNPVEFLIKGEVTTKSPFIWWNSVVDLKWNEIFSSDSETAVQRYARQLLSFPYMTGAHVDAFLKIAPDVEEVDLHKAHLGSNNIEELLEMCDTLKIRSTAPREFFSLGPIAKGALQKEIGLNPISAMSLIMILDDLGPGLKWLDDPKAQAPHHYESIFKEWKDGFQGDLNDPEARELYFLENLPAKWKFRDGESYISAKNLVRLIEGVSKNKKCRKIRMPLTEIIWFVAVRKALEKGGFKLDPTGGPGYKR